MLLPLGIATFFSPIPMALGRGAWVELRASTAVDCISVEDVERELEARTKRAAELLAKDPSFHVALLLERHERGVRGTVTLTRDGAPTERQVEGQSCREVAEALLLVTALAIDPSANMEKLSEAPSTPVATTVSKPPTTSTQSLPKPSPPNAGSVSTAVPTRRPRQRSASVVRIGVVGALRAGPLPAPAPLGGGLVEWEAERRFQPELRAAFYVSSSVQNRVGEGQAAFRLLSGRLDACGGLPLGPLRLRACAATELGVLHGSADSSPALETTRAESRVWLAGGALAELAVPLRPVALSARGGVLAPVIRDQFVRVRANGEQAQLHEPSAIGAVVEVSAAFALW